MAKPKAKNVTHNMSDYCDEMVRNILVIDSDIELDKDYPEIYKKVSDAQYEINWVDGPPITEDRVSRIIRNIVGVEDFKELVEKREEAELAAEGESLDDRDELLEAALAKSDADEEELDELRAKMKVLEDERNDFKKRLKKAKKPETAGAA